MAKLEPSTIIPETVYIDRLEYSVLPEKGYVYDADAEFFATEDEALDAALDWSVEEHGARVIIYKNNKPFRKISTFPPDKVTGSSLYSPFTNPFATLTMYEVWSTISDEYGTRDIPTGQGSVYYDKAESILKEYKKKYPKEHFYIERVQPEDWDCAY